MRFKKFAGRFEAIFNIAAVAYFTLTVLYLFIEFAKWIYKEMLQEHKNCLNEIKNCTFVDKKRRF